MASVSHRGAISYGILHVPVELYKAAEESKIEFNQLCPDGSRVRQKKVCASCGEEIESKNIQRGYEYGKDQYVLITDEELDSARTAQDRTIKIEQCAKVSEIDPIYYNDSYYALPESGAEAPYELLRRDLESLKLVGIARTVMHTKQKVLAIIPQKDVLLVKTLFYAEDIRSVPKAIPKVTLTKEELELGKVLLKAMTKKLDLTAYHNEYLDRLRSIISAKIEGKDIVASPETPLNNVVDIMAALRESLKKEGIAV